MALSMGDNGITAGSVAVSGHTQIVSSLWRRGCT